MIIGVNLHRSLPEFLGEGLDSVMSRYAELGVQQVEVPSEIVRSLDQDYLTKLLKSFSFRYSVHAPLGLDLAYVLEREEHRRMFYESLGLAYRVEANVLVVHPSTSRPQPGLGVVGGVVSKLARLAGDHGLVLALENLQPGDPTGRFYRVEDLVSVVESAGAEGVGVALDTGHLYLSSRFLGFSFRRSLALAHRNLVHVHLSDNYGVVSRSRRWELDVVKGVGDLHLPPGSGSAPIKQVLRTLSKRSFPGALIIDIKPYYVGLLVGSIKYVNRLLGSTRCGVRF